LFERFQQGKSTAAESMSRLESTRAGEAGCILNALSHSPNIVLGNFSPIKKLGRDTASRPLSGPRWPRRGWSRFTAWGKCQSALTPGRRKASASSQVAARHGKSTKGHFVEADLTPAGRPMKREPLGDGSAPGSAASPAPPRWPSRGRSRCRLGLFSQGLRLAQPFTVGTPLRLSSGGN
jgi:hypothetical protein